MESKDWHEIEEKYNLFDKKIDDFSYWVYSKYDINAFHFGKVFFGTGTFSKRKTTIKNIVVDGAELLYNSIFRSHVKKQHYDMVVFNHERRMKDGDYYNCIYTDELLKRFTSYVVVERTFKHRHFRPIQTENIIYSDYIEVKSNLYASIMTRLSFRKEYKRILNIIRTDLEKPLLDLENKFGKLLDKDAIYKLVMFKYYLYVVKKKCFSKMLKQFNPNVVVEVVGYNMDCMIANELSASMNYKTIELQHGFIGDQHPFYNYPKSVVHVNQVPQNILAFSDYFFKGINFPGVNVIVTGYPYLERKKVENPKIDHEGYVITFLSDVCSYQRMETIICDFLALINERKSDIKVLFKLHPGEMVGWKERYPRLVNSDAEVYATPDTNVYQCFAGSDAIVSAFSTAIFESFVYSLDIFIMMSSNYRNVENLVNDGYATLIDSADDLYNGIEKARKADSNTMSDFWPTGALDKMEKEIRKLLMK